MTNLALQMTMDKPLRKPPRCPKCKKLPVAYNAISSMQGYEIIADSHGRPTKCAYNYTLNTNRVMAACFCGYRWWLRDVAQITDLEQQPEQDTP